MISPAKTLLFGVVFSLLAFHVSAQQTAGRGLTLGMANGRTWMAMQSTRDKVYYLTGINDILISLNPPKAKDYQIAEISTSEVAAAIDAFYAVPENIRLPIIDALRVSILKFRGWSPAELESLTADLRKVVATAP